MEGVSVQTAQLVRSREANTLTASWAAKNPRLV